MPQGSQGFQSISQFHPNTQRDRQDSTKTQATSFKRQGTQGASKCSFTQQRHTSATDSFLTSFTVKNKAFNLIKPDLCLSSNNI